MKHSPANCSINSKSGPVPSRVAMMSSTINSSASLSLKILTALMGSPTYLGAAKRSVLTSPRRRSRRQGMTRVRSTSDLDEALEQLHSETMTLFRMELDAQHSLALDRARKFDAVARHGGDVGRIRAVRVV